MLLHCWSDDGKDFGLQKLDVSLLLVVTIWLQLCTSFRYSCHHHLHHP